MEMDAGAIRNFKDFLQLYNKMSEICFGRCINNVNSRKLDVDEIACVEDCSSKFIKFNNKLMQNFVAAQTEIVNRRVEEAEKQKQVESTLTQPEQDQVASASTHAVKDNPLIDNTLKDSALDQSELIVSK